MAEIEENYGTGETASYSAGTEEQKQNVEEILAKYSLKNYEGNEENMPSFLKDINKSPYNEKSPILKKIDSYYNFYGITTPKVSISFLDDLKRDKEGGSVTKTWKNLDDAVENSNSNNNNFFVSARIDDNGSRKISLTLFDRTFYALQKIIFRAIKLTGANTNTPTDDQISKATQADIQGSDVASNIRFIKYNTDIVNNIKIRWGYTDSNLDNKTTILRTNPNYFYFKEGDQISKIASESNSRWNDRIGPESEVEKDGKLTSIGSYSTVANEKNQSTMVSQEEEFFITNVKTSLTATGIKYTINAVGADSFVLNSYKFVQMYSELRGTAKELMAFFMKTFNEPKVAEGLNAKDSSLLRVCWDGEEDIINGTEYVKDYFSGEYVKAEDANENSQEKVLNDNLDLLNLRKSILNNTLSCAVYNQSNDMQERCLGGSNIYYNDVMNGDVQLSEYLEDVISKGSILDIAGVYFGGEYLDKDFNNKNIKKMIGDEKYYFLSLLSNRWKKISYLNNKDKWKDNLTKLTKKQIILIYIASVIGSAYKVETDVLKIDKVNASNEYGDEQNILNSNIETYMDLINSPDLDEIEDVNNLNLHYKKYGFPSENIDETIWIEYFNKCEELLKKNLNKNEYKIDPYVRNEYLNSIKGVMDVKYNILQRNLFRENSYNHITTLKFSKKPDPYLTNREIKYYNSDRLEIKKDDHPLTILFKFFNFYFNYQSNKASVYGSKYDIKKENFKQRKDEIITIFNKGFFEVKEKVIPYINNQIENVWKDINFFEKTSMYIHNEQKNIINRLENIIKLVDSIDNIFKKNNEKELIELIVKDNKINFNEKDGKLTLINGEPTITLDKYVISPSDILFENGTGAYISNEYGDIFDFNIPNNCTAENFIEIINNSVDYEAELKRSFYKYDYDRNKTVNAYGVIIKSKNNNEKLDNKFKRFKFIVMLDNSEYYSNDINDIDCEYLNNYDNNEYSYINSITKNYIYNLSCDNNLDTTKYKYSLFYIIKDGNKEFIELSKNDYIEKAFKKLYELTNLKKSNSKADVAAYERKIVSTSEEYGEKYIMDYANNIAKSISNPKTSIMLKFNNSDLNYDISLAKDMEDIISSVVYLGGEKFENIIKEIKNRLSDINTKIEEVQKALEKFENGKEAGIIRISLGGEDAIGNYKNGTITSNPKKFKSSSSMFTSYCSQTAPYKKYDSIGINKETGKEIYTSDSGEKQSYNTINENGEEVTTEIKSVSNSRRMGWSVIGVTGKNSEPSGLPIVGFHYIKPIRPKYIRQYDWGTGNPSEHCVKDVNIETTSEFGMMSSASFVNVNNGTSQNVGSKGTKVESDSSFINNAFVNAVVRNDTDMEKLSSAMINGVKQGTIQILGDPSLRFDGNIQPASYPIYLNIQLQLDSSWSNTPTISQSCQLSGYYVVTEISHNLSNRGYTTDLKVMSYPGLSKLINNQ